MSTRHSEAATSLARELLGVGRCVSRSYGMPFVASLLLIVQLLLSATRAAGQSNEPPSPAADHARLAEALFDEAKQAMDRGDYASACSKLEESRRLDPAGGTELALGVCYERAGKLASAWYAYREAYAAAQRDARADREAIAEQRLSALEPRLSRVTVVVPPEVATLPGLRVELGYLELRPPSWGLAVPFDPGSYVLRVSAPGYVPWTRDVAVGSNADHQTVELPMLVAAPPDPASPARATVASNVSSRRPAARDDSGSSSINQKLGFVFAGAAVAALIPAVYFGGRAIAGGESVNEACNGGDRCPEDVAADHEDALADARRANVFFVTSLVAAGVSVYFFLTAKPSSSPAQKRVGLGPASLRLAF